MFVKNAELRLTGIWLYTYQTWAFDQAEKYYNQIVLCCESVGGGKARSKPVEGLTDDIYVHRCAQHYISFCRASGQLSLQSCMVAWISLRGYRSGFKTHSPRLKRDPGQDA